MVDHERFDRSANGIGAMFSGKLFQQIDDELGVRVVSRGTFARGRFQDFCVHRLGQVCGGGKFRDLFRRQRITLMKLGKNFCGCSAVPTTGAAFDAGNGARRHAHYGRKLLLRNASRESQAARNGTWVGRDHD